MASGWAADGAENAQIEDTINDAIARADGHYLSVKVSLTVTTVAHLFPKRANKPWRGSGTVFSANNLWKKNHSTLRYTTAAAVKIASCANRATLQAL